MLNLPSPGRLRLPVLAALGGCALLAACAAPAPSTTSSTSTRGGAYVPPDAPTYGPGELCAETYVIVGDNARTNFSLGSENYRNDDFCAAYPYLKWLTKNEPLFTGEDPDDRNFLRLASVYEYFASETEDEAEKKAYLDSSLTTRQMGRQTMDRQNIAYDTYLRDLREGFFYFQNSPLYPDAEEKQFDAFSRAFQAQPDSLEDWYIGQLFNASALKFEDRAARAAYVQKLTPYVDDPTTKDYYTNVVTFLTTEPAEAGIATDSAVEALIAAEKNGTIRGDDVLSLLALAIQDPERVTAAGGDPDAIRSSLIRRREVTENVSNPRTLFALAIQEFQNGNATRGNQLFDQAIQNAGSNAQRADFYYARASRGYGNRSQLYAQALQYQPNHGPSLYQRALAIADAAGRPSSTAGRAAYWCLSDIFRNVAASGDPRVAAAARRAAAQYERAGPSRERYFLDLGWRPGESVNASLGSYGSCTTRVR